MKETALIAAGGAIGATLRDLVGGAMLRLSPCAMSTINIAGPSFMGVSIGLPARRFGTFVEFLLFAASGRSCAANGRRDGR